MQPNREKCHHLFEFVMGSRVCKRCGLIEQYKSSLYTQKEEKEDLKIIS